MADYNDDTTRSPSPPIRAFPSSRLRELRSEYGPDSVKLIHVVRHAEGTHNVNKEYNDPVHADARLTRRGAEQCAELAASLESEHLRRVLDSRLSIGKDDGDDDSAGIAVVTSPMTRCIQTAMLSFPSLLAAPDVPFVAHEGFRETVNYHCDRRRTLAELAADYGGAIDFALLAGDDADPLWERYRRRLPPGWNRHMESADLASVVARAQDGLAHVAGRPEREVVVCTHSAFLRCVLNHGQTGGVPQRPPQNLAASFVVSHGAKKDGGSDGSKGGDGKQEPSSGTGGEKNDARTTDQKIFDYDNTDGGAFEEYMRRNYENCELRSFCLLFPSPVSRSK